MFKRRNGPTNKEQMHIGQPQLLHTTYDQQLMPKWPGLVASNAPSEYFERPFDALPSSLFKYRRLDESLETGSVFRPGRDQQVSPPPDDNSGDYSLSSSSSQLPHPLRSHLRTQSDLPSIPSSQTSASSAPFKPRSKTRKTSSSLSSHIPLFHNQLAKARRSPDPGEATYSVESLHGSSDRQPKMGSSAWEEQKLNSDPRYQVSVAVSPPNEKPPKTKKGSWTERAARIRKDTFDSRPPWKGGMGRSSIVDPVNDTSVPRTVNRYTAVRDMSRGRLAEGESDNSLASSRFGGREMSPVSMMGGRYEEDYHAVARNDSTLDYEDKDVSPLATPSTAAPPPTDDAPWNLPRKVTRKPVGLRKASGGGHSSLILESNEEDEPSYMDHAEVTIKSSANKDKTLPPMLPIASDNTSVSRFSWTTVNTVATSQLDSPPPSPHVEPVPPLPLYHENRTGHKSIVKPPTPPLIDHEGDAIDKELPKAPISSKSMTHVETLTAQESELNVRRRNIQRIIHELAQVENASPLEIDWKTSKAMKKKLEERRAQLADVEREQHELGLAIARARRRAEREDGFESGLWVRRME